MAKKMKNKWLIKTAMLLVAVGAINWGLVSVLGFNLVSFLLGWSQFLIKVVYLLVGLSGVWALIEFFK